MVVVDGQGVPLGSHLDRASPAEVTLVAKTLAQVRVPGVDAVGRGASPNVSLPTWVTTAIGCVDNSKHAASN